VFETNAINLLERAMNGSNLRHAVLSNNLANVNTPEYKRGDVEFRSLLGKEMESHLLLKKTRDKHLDSKEVSVEPVMIDYSSTSLRNDGNNVDIDMENAALAENTLYFNGIAKFLSSRLSLLRYAVTEGRK